LTGAGARRGMVATPIGGYPIVAVVHPIEAVVHPTIDGWRYRVSSWRGCCKGVARVCKTAPRRRRPSPDYGPVMAEATFRLP
jgi:hypothetical protein